MPSRRPLVVVPKKWNSDHISVLNLWPSCPRKVVDYGTRVFHCRSCLNMFVDGVTVVCDHGVSSAHDHGTLLLAVEVFSYVKRSFVQYIGQMLATWVKILHSIILAKQQLHVQHTFWYIKEPIGLPHISLPSLPPYDNNFKRPNFTFYRWEREREILEREILSRHGSFISKSYNLRQNWENGILEEHFSKHRSCSVPIFPPPSPWKQWCCVPAPSTFVGSNIELGKVISFHKAAGLEIVLFRRIVYIMGKTFSRSFVQDYSLHKSRVKKNVYIYQQFRVDINKFEKYIYIYL